MHDIDDALREAFAEDFSSFLLVGDAEGSRAATRRLLGAASSCHSVVATRRGQGWPADCVVHELGGERTPALVLRSALRMDPDLIVLEVAREELDSAMLELIMGAALTGHALLVCVEGCPEPGPIMESLSPLLARYPEGFPCPLPRILACDSEGVTRVVATTSGEVVCQRGQPLPERPTLTGREPRPAPAAPEPTQPLEPEILERLRQALEPQLRSTFVPRLSKPRGDAACSKLGGLPLLSPGEAWPSCATCSAPMPLALQLARDECPEPARSLFPAGAFHLQLFYCSSSSCGAEDAWEPFGSNRLLRFLGQSEPAREVPACPEPPQAADLVGWDERSESPHSEDLPDLADDLAEARWQLSDLADEGGADSKDLTLAGPRLGNRLLGWPAWAQGSELPTCPSCGERMAFVFQLDANSGPLCALFAADGTGHVTQCPKHPEVLAFAWACG